MTSERLYYFCGDLFNYTSAGKFCSKRGMKLALPRNQTEDEFIASISQDGSGGTNKCDDSPWLGFPPDKIQYKESKILIDDEVRWQNDHHDGYRNSHLKLSNGSGCLKHSISQKYLTCMISFLSVILCIFCRSQSNESGEFYPCYSSE